MTTIEPLSAHHVPAVAALHVASLEGLLTMLGVRAARAYYAASVGAPGGAAFVAVEGGTTCGFVAGSVSARAFRRNLAARSPGALFGAAALGTLRRPAAVRWLLQSLRGTGVAGYDPNAAELTYIAVAAGARGSGVGRRLVTAFSDAMRAAGVPRYELSVDEDNRDAAAFYERLGFVRIGRYREFGRNHVRYAIDIGAAVRP